MTNPTPKICKCCKEEKSLDCFGNNIRQKDGLNCYCRACIKTIHEARKETDPEYYRKYREKNKEKLREYHKEYRKKNSIISNPNEAAKIQDAKEKKRAKQKEKAKNPDYILSRRYYFRKKYLEDEQFKLK